MATHEDRVHQFHPDEAEILLMDLDHRRPTEEILEALDLIHSVYGEHPVGRAGRAADRLYIELGCRVRLGGL